MNRYLLLIMATTMTLSSSLGQNPISPPGVYLADPSARVFEDGRLYVYCSVDRNLDSWCSHTQHVLSTDDMINWTLHRDVFCSTGPEDKVPYSDRVLFAPDAFQKDGKVFLYYCMPDPKFPEGVAVSDNPVGGFSEGKPMKLMGHNQIDPAVFMDDDGSMWYLWGQFTLKMARLDEDMQSIDESTLHENVITESEHRFHEGIYMTKRNGLYYLVYAHLDKAHRPTQIGYSTSTNPTGPYTYGGIIIDNDHCDLGTWNNHGCLIKFKDQWYVFYHRSTHGSPMMRKACVEPVEFNEDGSIPEVEMTTQGAGPPLDPAQSIDAASACVLHGNVRIEGRGQDNEVLAGIKSGDRALYRYVQFTGREKAVRLRAKASGKATVRIVANSPWNLPLASILMDGTGNWEEYSVATKALDGKNALWLVFSLGETTSLEIDSLLFD